MAQKALNDAAIRAPISGYVSARPLSVGEYVTPTSKVATILRVNPIKLHIQLPEAESARVRQDMSVVARVAAHGEEQFSGKVTAVNPAVDPNSRSITVEVKIANPSLALRPGMFATANILLPEGEKAHFVPREAVLTDDSTNSSQVFIVEGDKARVRVVQVGERDNHHLRILSGVSNGQVVAINNLDQLYDGVAVERQQR